jgi:hypothetical protein
VQLLTWLYALGTALVVINTIATLALWFGSGASLQQRLGQTLVIWLLPAVGGLLVIHLHWEAASLRGRKTSLSPKAPHQYVSQTLEAEARIANHATDTAIEHSVVEAFSDSSGGAADGH